MAVRGRDRKKPLAQGVRVKGGKPLLLALGVAGLWFISNGVQIALT